MRGAEISIFIDCFWLFVECRGLDWLCWLLWLNSCARSRLASWHGTKGAPLFVGVHPVQRSKLQQEWKSERHKKQTTCTKNNGCSLNDNVLSVSILGLFQGRFIFHRLKTALSSLPVYPLRLSSVPVPLAGSGRRMERFHPSSLALCVVLPCFLPFSRCHCDKRPLDLPCKPRISPATLFRWEMVTVWNATSEQTHNC